MGDLLGDPQPEVAQGASTTGDAILTAPDGPGAADAEPETALESGDDGADAPEGEARGPIELESPEPTEQSAGDQEEDVGSLTFDDSGDDAPLDGNTNPEERQAVPEQEELKNREGDATDGIADAANVVPPSEEESDENALDFGNLSDPIILDDD
jgi:hypothetical protein